MLINVNLCLLLLELFYYQGMILFYLKVTAKKDSGIFLTADLNNYKTHITSITCKTYKALRFLKRISFEFQLTSYITALYCSLVRHLMDYGSVL